MVCLEEKQRVVQLTDDKCSERWQTISPKKKGERKETNDKLLYHGWGKRLAKA
jgi:hypothetical protein